MKSMKENILKKSTGITLVTLVVTIIVLLILASISIKALVDDGIIDKTQEAKIKSKEQVEYEQKQLEIMREELDEMRNGPCEHEWEDGICVECGKEKPRLEPGTKVNEDTEFIQDDGQKAMIPEGFTLSGADTEDEIDEGLVIYLIDDKTDDEIENIDWSDEEILDELRKTYDQFVWTPVNNINDMYMCQEEDGTYSCNIIVKNEEAICTTHNSNMMAGRLYEVKTTWQYDGNLDNQTFDVEGIREPAVVNNDSSNLSNIRKYLGTEGYEDVATFEQTLQDEYNEIVKSVFENDGFYMGRYEVYNISAELQIVAGVTPTYYSDWYNFYGACRNYASANKLKARSAMVQGAAYDEVLRFVNTETFDVTQSGHVAQSNFTASCPPYHSGGDNYDENYNIEPGESGYVAYNDVSKNIYDLEGNLRCWTTTAYSTTHRFVRGSTRMGGDLYGSISGACEFNSIGPGIGSTGIKDGGIIMLYI